MRKPEGYVEIVDGWLFPKCFLCEEDIILNEGGEVLLFKCGCRERVCTRQNYEIISREDVIWQTLFFNKCAQNGAYLKWYQENKEEIPTKELYMALKRTVVMEEV